MISSVQTTSFITYEMALHLRSHIIIYVFSFIFLLHINPLSAVANVCKQDNYYHIKTQDFSLVLDASGPVVLLQHVNGKPSQLWSFHCGSKPGLFIIENKETGDVLDYLENFPQKVITEPRDGSLYQEWSINNDGGIINAAAGMAMDVYYGNFTEGNFVQVYEQLGFPAQKFVMQRRRDVANLL